MFFIQHFPGKMPEQMNMRGVAYVDQDFQDGVYMTVYRKAGRTVGWSWYQKSELSWLITGGWQMALFLLMLYLSCFTCSHQ